MKPPMVVRGQPAATRSDGDFRERRCMGFFISSFTSTVEATNAVANMVTMPMMFLGGVFFPVDSAPSWIQPVVRIMPVKYLADGLRDVMIRGRGLSAVWSDLVFLGAVGLFFALLSLRVFRWRE